jgi:hypothetical protein
MRIEIRKRADKGYNVPVVYEVCVVAMLPSGYLHARPESSSGLKLDPGVFL